MVYRPHPGLDFVDIATRTWLFTPEKRSPGHLVIICTWLGAAPKHTAKYINLHRSIAPAARILLVESAVPILVSSYSHQRHAIRPAAAVALESLAEASSFNPSKILLHTFSNGGTNTATQLLVTLRDALNEPFPLAGLVLDSAPAKGTYWKSYHAMVFSLPPPTRLLGSGVIHFLLVLLYAWIACGNENPASLMRRILLDEHSVRAGNNMGPSASQGNICYLYSKADQMTDWRDVRDHARDAKQKRWSVQEVMFNGSGHCAHMAQDPSKYASAVRRVWNGQVAKSASKL